VLRFAHPSHILAEGGYDEVLVIDVQPSFTYDQAVVIGRTGREYTIHSHTAGANLNAFWAGDDLSYDTDRLRRAPVVVKTLVAADSAVQDACTAMFAAVRAMRRFQRPVGLVQLDGETTVLTLLAKSGYNKRHKVWRPELEFEDLVVEYAKVLNAYVLLDDEFRWTDGHSPEDQVFVDFFVRHALSDEQKTAAWSAPRSFALRLLRACPEGLADALRKSPANRAEVLRRYRHQFEEVLTGPLDGDEPFH